MSALQRWLVGMFVLAALLTPIAPAVAQDTEPDRRAELQAASNWVYVLQQLDAPMFAALHAVPADVVVIDAISTLNEENDLGVEAAVEVAALHALPGLTLPRRLVLAYVDIGQAEEHRTYWQDGWAPGNPDWIAGLDPDGWEGNYPVAFWRQEWRDLMRAAVEQIASEGFDGIYMDWVEAYSDENVAAMAQASGVFAPEAMVGFIEEIGVWGRQINPQFLVVAQNAAELLEEAPRYLEVIDGLAQEQLHYDGSALEGGRPGDCPLPLTDAQIGTPEYVASLPPGCADLSTLQVSTEWYLSYLRPIRDAGIKVFVVDYAVEADNLLDAFQRSLAEGFVPYAGRRQLDAIGTVYGVHLTPASPE